MKKIVLAITALFCICNLHAQTFMGLYDFASVTTTSGLTDPTTLPTATGVTFSHFVASDSLSANSQAAARFNFSAWGLGATTGNDIYSSLTGSINLNEYYAVTIAPAAGYSIQLDSLVIAKVTRSNAGVRTYAVRSSIDNYATNLTAVNSTSNPDISVQAGNIFFWVLDANGGVEGGSKIVLGGSTFSNIHSAVTFRIYAWNAEVNAGTFSLDDVKLYGSATQLQVSAIFSASSVCQGIATTFTESSTTLSPPITNWHWDYGDTQTANFTSQTNPTHTYATCNTYQVKLVVTNMGGQMDSTTQSVTVNCIPSASINPGTSASVCSGSSVTLTANTGTGLSYVWKKDGSPITGATNGTYAANTAGSYVVEVSGPGGCTTPSSPTVVTVNPKPVAAFTASALSGAYTFNNTTTGATTYEWNFGDTTATSSSTNPTHTYLFNGLHNVCLKAYSAAGCIDSICHTVNVIGLGIEKINPSLILSVSPNPSRGLITVDVTNLNIQNSAIKVYSIIGKEIEHLDVTQVSQDLYHIDLSSQVDGFYFVRVFTPKEVFTWRVAISR